MTRASPVVALRKALLTRLSGDAPLLALLGGAKIYDEAPRAAEPPYVLFAEVQARDWSTSDSRGCEQILALSAISTQRGLREALDIAQRVVELLDEVPLVLQDHHLVDLRHIATETKREQNGRFARASTRFRATTETI
jgi:hypothetical protein